MQRRVFALLVCVGSEFPGSRGWLLSCYLRSHLGGCLRSFPFCLVDFWDVLDSGYWLYIVSLLSSWAELVVSYMRGFQDRGSDARSLVYSSLKVGSGSWFMFFPESVLFDEFFDDFILLFYFSSLYQNVLVMLYPHDMILSSLSQRSDNEVIYDNFTTTRTLAQRASSDHTWLHSFLLSFHPSFLAW